MATANDIKIRSYCDAVSSKLTSMKEGIHALQEEAKNTYGKDSEQSLIYRRHLCELADMIDWKLQLLMKACPFDWKARDSDVESIVSVKSLDKESDLDFAGGYIGG